MELVNINYKGTGVSPQDLSAKDQSLVTSNYIFSQFGRPNDVIELHISEENGEILLSDYNATDYYPYLTTNPVSGLYSSLTLDPEKDVKSRGFNRGIINAQYNFLSNLFNSSQDSKYWIKEISKSRTEIKLASQTIPDSLIRSGFNQFDGINRAKNYYVLFYLNFGKNQLVVANNVIYTEDEAGSYLLIKLYEPLPSQFDVKDQLWIVDKVAESANFTISIEVQAEEVTNFNALRGPNYNVVINTKGGQSTPYYTYNDLIASPITSSFQKLNSYYQDKAAAINVDYSNFSNFVKFSSATERVNNFVYKVGLIETSLNNITSQSAISAGPQSSIILASSSLAEQRVIDNIIKNFDTYEYFLYFESSSWAWPKSNTTQPYRLCSVTSSQAISFIGSETTVPTSTTASLLFSASYYDSTNKDILRNTAPQYILDDSTNQPFVTFLDMIGQHFDNIWIYYKDVTNRFSATNNPDTGISMDLVSDALTGLGYQLFTNTNVSDNLYYSLFGINQDGSLLPPTGSELITEYVTSSLTTQPAETIQDEIYKRLYHNLPYLYKTKGTARSIKSLISIYGIPDGVLTVREFGGQPSGSLRGILDLDSQEYKVNIATGSNGAVTGSATISSSLLSPYTTIQYYEGKNRINNPNIEVGFSPTDIINNNITSSLPALSVDQLVGSPGYMYSSSYTPLVSASISYFGSYTQKNSVWEYIRLLKFYNNSLFKTIKEFVPARANVSTGIIIKSHMLERNKYARHEPSMSISVLSQSIDIGAISGSEGGALTDSTSWNGFLVTPLGLAQYSSSKGEEKFTGELSGSRITVTDGNAMQQSDYVSGVTGSMRLYNYGATHQNVTSSVRSITLLDVDYSSNAIKPVNFGLITYSISQSQVNRYDTYTNRNNPYAEVQDYNYYIERSIRPRYEGSQNISATYNTYTAPGEVTVLGQPWPGDKSYGKTAAVDKLKYQFAYIVNIDSSSFQMPNRAKGQIKYIIDRDQNVLNLSKNNINWFEVQNIFKSGEYADVSLFDYDPSNPYVDKLNNSQGDFTIWESGYAYSPIIYSSASNTSPLTYSLDTPITLPGTAGTPSTTVALATNARDYWTSWETIVVSPGSSVYIAQVTGSTINGPAPTTATVTVTYYLSNPFKTPTRYPASTNATLQIPAGTTPKWSSSVYLGSSYSTWNGDSPSVVVISQTTGSPATPGTPGTVTNIINDRTSSWQVVSPGDTIYFSATQSAYYGGFVSTGSYPGMSAFVFPFNVSVNDIVRLYNYSTSRWDASGEFRVIEVGSTNSGSSPVVNYQYVKVDRVISSLYTSDFTNQTYPFRLYKYLALKRLQDETSIYFNFNLEKNIPQEGTVFPEYLDENVKKESGNVIKALKQQNLI